MRRIHSTRGWLTTARLNLAISLAETHVVAAWQHISSWLSSPGPSQGRAKWCESAAISLLVFACFYYLLDAGLLAEVYLALLGGRQPGLSLVADAGNQTASAEPVSAPRPARPHAPSEAEVTAHAAFVDGLKDPLWRR